MTIQTSHRTVVKAIGCIFLISFYTNDKKTPGFADDLRILYILYQSIMNYVFKLIKPCVKKNLEIRQKFSQHVHPII